MKLQNLILVIVIYLWMPVTSAAQEIFDALKANDLGKVKALIEKDVSLINIKDNNGSTPLHSAAITGFVPVTEYLLSMGADINLQENRGYTPLHYACHYNVENVAVLLIEKGARVDIKENRGLTPIFLAARAGNLKVVKLLAEKGSDVNASIPGVWVTPLSWAAENGYREVVDWLLDNGAHADVKNNMLIRFSVTRGLSKLFNTLLSNGANFDLRNSNGGNIIHLAAEGGSVDIIKALIQDESEINKPDRYGWTPLHYAAYNDRKDAVSFLIDNGASTNASDYSGETPYTISIGRGNQEIIKLLKGGKPDDNLKVFPTLKNDYLGQKKPGVSPEVFALGIVSTVEIEHGNITTSPDGSEIFWTSSYKPPVIYGSSGSFKVWSSKRVGNQWSAPKLSFLTKNEITTDDVPFISPDGKRMIFMSRRSIYSDGNDEMKEYYWYVDKTNNGWTEPKLLDATINDLQIRWQVSISKSRTLFFCASRPDGKGGSDIYMSKLTDGKYLKPENLGDSVNSKAEEVAPFIAPDESYILFSKESRTDRSLKSGLYVAYRNSEGTWTKPVYLGDEINQGGASCPYISPDGKYLFFNSGRNGNYDIYWVSAKIIEELRPKL
jgi:ankyrin repeat protein/Tol biopolymer transport system component